MPQGTSKSLLNQSSYCAFCQKKWGFAAIDMCLCGKHIVSSCPQTKLGVGCIDCTQLITLPLNGWRYTACKCTQQQPHKFLDTSSIAGDWLLSGVCKVCSLNVLRTVSPCPKTPQICSKLASFNESCKPTLCICKKYFKGQKILPHICGHLLLCACEWYVDR